MSSVLITGVSSGIGHALAEEYLNRKWTVFGTSRRLPEDLQSDDGFQFATADFAIPESITRAVGELLGDQSELDLMILNAGRLGVFGDMGEADLFELKTTMQVNLWANKTLLDTVFAMGIPVHQVVTISSGAAVNGNRGWSGYSISKAALNMLTQLYAQERPDTHFCGLAPGVVDTAIQDELLEREPDARFPAVEVLRSKRDTAEMPKPREAAVRLIEVFEKLPSVIPSGDFADIRKPPLVE